MRFAHASVGALLVVIVGCSATSTSQQAGPLEGAWRLTGILDVSADGSTTAFTPQENLLLFSRDHYSMAYAFGDERSPAYAQPFSATDEERAARLSSLVVNTGTYEVSGSTITLRPLFALVPEFVGGSAEIDYEVSGDQLTLRWRRTVSASGVEHPFTASGVSTELTLTRLR
jgi:hypothetical protein